MSNLAQLINLQLINGISNDLKKLDKYFSKIAIFALVNNLWAPEILGSGLAAIFLELRPFRRLDLYLKDIQ